MNPFDDETAMTAWYDHRFLLIIRAEYPDWWEREQWKRPVDGYDPGEWRLDHE